MRRKAMIKLESWSLFLFPNKHLTTKHINLKVAMDSSKLKFDYNSIVKIKTLSSKLVLGLISSSTA